MAKAIQPDAADLHPQIDDAGMIVRGGHPAVPGFETRRVVELLRISARPTNTRIGQD
jgi:hypothetical protein